MTENNAPVLSDFERAAVKEAAKESRTRAARKKVSPEELRAAGEADVLAKIAEMDEEDGSLATALHRLVAENAPHLVPKTYYGHACLGERRRQSRLLLQAEGQVQGALRHIRVRVAGATRRRHRMARVLRRDRAHACRPRLPRRAHPHRGPRGVTPDPDFRRSGRDFGGKSGPDATETAT
ncbi:hypothetical protein [Microbacterium sp. 2MCAF23]|uniref:hypothetical protein n=1 Tax=Microbacterium sp. 2MCAF23 TaxID=3232985 RepID=UPI003F9C42C8